MSTPIGSEELIILMVDQLNKYSKEKGWIFFLTLKDMLILCKEENIPYLIETQNFIRFLLLIRFRILSFVTYKLLFNQYLQYDYMSERTIYKPYETTLPNIFV